MGQARGIVSIRITAGQAIDALAQEIGEAVLDLGCLATINQTSSERGGELQFLIRRLQQ